MSIHFNSITPIARSYFIENIIPLSDRQKRIAVIVSVAFAFLTYCYLIRRCCFEPTARYIRHEIFDQTWPFRAYSKLRWGDEEWEIAWNWKENLCRWNHL